MANFNIDYLVVAGGGAGGGYYRGGGGGAGELKESASSIALSTGSSYDVVVGAGGAGVIVSSDNGSNGNNGDNSTFYNITSLGGGGGSPGDSSSGNTGSDGGSGGGAGGNWGGTSANGGFANGTGLGNNGGAGAVIQCGGGGGGANTVGFNAGTSGADGDGGAGKVYTAATSITGQPFAVAGGGGGANYGAGNITIGGVGGGAAGASGSSPYTSGPSGANNTGGGGGGGNGVSPQGAGGNGGSGIVILRYTTADVAGYTTTGSTPTEDTTTISGQTILSFTTVGTGTITFTAPAIPITPFDGTRVTTPVTGFDKINTTQGLKLPSGTNSNQPAGVSAIQGMIRNDTEETVDSSASAMTHYNGTAWQYFAATESADSVVPLENFNTVIYTGSTSPHAITGFGFQPDLIWVKNRDQSDSYAIVDSVRGITSPAPYIASDTTDAQLTSTNMPTSVQSDGFTITGNGGRTNTSGEDYVAWCWKAGGAAVPNTNGSITSQVSANVAAGFSIVKYNSGTSAITAGHGLSQAVEMVICKPLVSGPWAVWNKYMATDLDKNYIPLTTAVVTPNASSLWNYSNWGATKIGSNNPLMFGNSNDVICYCFHSVPGYSKVGSYTGNGSTNGPVINLGFEPAWIMIKCTSFSERWVIYDNKRSTSNPRSKVLAPNSGAYEIDTVYYNINFTTTGFTVNGTANFTNKSGETFIYYAIA